MRLQQWKGEGIISDTGNGTLGKVMKGMLNYIRTWLIKLGEWMKPDPADTLLLQIFKTIYKTIALLIMIALSPVILVVLLFVFFAAV